MIFYLLAILFFGIGIFLLEYVKWAQRRNSIKLETEIKETPNVAVFIPARDESKVIEELLSSIEHQTIVIPRKNIYVIVESETDKTVEIVKKHHMNFFVRKKLHLKTKGYALKELVEDLEQKKEYYDCYFIFDADNILTENYMEKMLEDYKKGYAISTGYRALKNPDCYFPVSAGLTFYIMNNLHNKAMVKAQGNLILSGTGYYIHGRLIKEWGTFPFSSLTEDYESSLYYTLHRISTHYQEEAVFFDEQPTHYMQSIRQRSRWIKGYFENWCIYRKKLRVRKKENPCNLGSVIEMYIGILPLVHFIISGVLLLFALLSNMIWSHNLKIGIFLLFFLLLFYLGTVLLSFFLLRALKRKNKISKKVFLQSMFYHPVFLLSYVHAFVLSWKKNLGWEKIAHGKREK